MIEADKTGGIRIHISHDALPAESARAQSHPGADICVKLCKTGRQCGKRCDDAAHL